MYRIFLFSAILESVVGSSAVDSKTLNSLRLLTTGRYIIVLDRLTVTTGLSHFKYKYMRNSQQDVNNHEGTFLF